MNNGHNPPLRAATFGVIQRLDSAVRDAILVVQDRQAMDHLTGDQFAQVEKTLIALEELRPVMDHSVQEGLRIRRLQSSTKRAGLLGEDDRIGPSTDC